MKNSYQLIVIAILFSFATSINAQTAGTMSFAFSDINPNGGWYQTRTNQHVLAVWIESCTTCGAGTTLGTSTFVRTKIRNVGGSTDDHLPTWMTKCGCGSATYGYQSALDAACNIANATTGATLSTFGAHSITWDGKNSAQTTLLPDGNYRVCVQETWGHGSSTVTRYFPFVKGPNAYTNITDVAADTHFTGITLTWTPTLTSETFTKEVNFVVYPNPTKGYINVDFKSNVKSIKIVDVLGKEVFNEETKDATADTSKKIDLSSFTNGVYIVTVSDNDGNSSTQRVILDK